MFDLAPAHWILVAVAALIFIGPKDLPKALRVAGYWVGKARGVARQFRQGFDNMVREAELEEMEKKWRAENERIMREHPPESFADADADADADIPPQLIEPPVMTERPPQGAAAADPAQPEPTVPTAVPVAERPAP